MENRGGYVGNGGWREGKGIEEVDGDNREGGGEEMKKVKEEKGSEERRGSGGGGGEKEGSGGKREGGGEVRIRGKYIKEFSYSQGEETRENGKRRERKRGVGIEKGKEETGEWGKEWKGGVGGEENNRREGE